MTRIRALIAVGVAAALTGGGWLLLGTRSGEAPHSVSAVAVPSATSTTAAPAPPTAARPKSPAHARPLGPPTDTVHTPARYLSHYKATRVGWDHVLARGHPLPRPGPGCAQQWRASGLDARIDGRRAAYWCLDGLPGQAYTPQGIAGSGTAEGYKIGRKFASNRNIVLTSWYSRSAEPGLFAANAKGDSVTRLVVIDLDSRRYATVELVRPDGRDRLRRLNSHGAGLAWTGQYLYSSSRSWVWLFNADDLMSIHGHLVLPAVARWSVSGNGGASSISLHRGSGADSLTAINYTKTGQTLVQSFALDRHGLLATDAPPAAEPLVLTTGFGEDRRVIRSVATATVPGTHCQGIGSWGRYRFANSSSLLLPGRSHRGDATVVLRDDVVVNRFSMPGGNVESVYVDPRRRSYASLTEGGSRFLFVLPLSELAGRHRR